MDRRTACASLAALAACIAQSSRAQPRRPLHVAFLSSDSPQGSVALVNFVRGLRDRGYVEGKTLRLETYWGNDSVERAMSQLPAILASRPDILVAIGGQVAKPLKDAGVTLPVVFTYSGDPVAGGMVQSYARPGGNFTGLSYFLAELVVKRLEILREIIPRLKRIAFVGWSHHAGEPYEVRVALAASASAGVEASYHPAAGSDDIAPAYEAASKRGAQAMSAFADGVTLANAARMAELSRRYRMPTVSGWADFTLQGNLFSWGPNREAGYAHLASFVERIDKGARPADLPVERPAVLELVVNTRAARELGITIPPSVLARASQAFD
jgi:putative ABC transport system substrate-binding protein